MCSQVDEAAPLWGARPVRGTCESQPAAAEEALRPHREEVEQPPPDLQVETPAAQGDLRSWRVSEALGPLIPWAEASGFPVGLSGRLPFPAAHCRVPGLPIQSHPHADWIGPSPTAVFLERTVGPFELCSVLLSSLPAPTNNRGLASPAQVGSYTGGGFKGM